MANKERTRMYCHPDFKKMMDLRRIEYGEPDNIQFTKKVSKNPDLIKGSLFQTRKNDDKKKKPFPSLF